MKLLTFKIISLARTARFYNSKYSVELVLRNGEKIYFRDKNNQFMESFNTLKWNIYNRFKQT